MKHPQFLLDALSQIVTIAPDDRSHTMPLRTAIRRVIDCRPPARLVEIHVEGGVLEEDEIEPLYALISLPI
ncbi:hypothetical protein VQ042_15765 [Aurantimonas sp. A2-1-M11]|uniref:hypothetical protein n=1 Tax=Aurantimonas sp. A2-1-M11 TaxID=3113712 RepID=UPI002F91E982